MRLLLIHADNFSFAVTEETSVAKLAERREDTKDSGKFGECLVAFIAVEKEDESALTKAATNVAETIAKQAKTLQVKEIVVYPYAHLSSSLASPRKADQGLALIVEALKKSPYKIAQAPFGYYKQFTISCKGHPLSELGQTITAESKVVKEESQALVAEKKKPSSFSIMEKNGAFVSPDTFDFKKKEGLRALYAYETAGTRIAGAAPPHVKLMRELEWLDYEPASDPGNFRWYPKGQLIKRLLERRVSDLMAGYGGMQVETPIMYDYNHPHLARYLERFPARQYILRSEEKEYFLRFAACFGQYLIAHDAVFSYRNLPLKLYELTHYSFRREQTGELAGLRRLRSFTMPDIHTLVRDIDMAKEEFLKQVALCREWCQDLNLPVEVAVRFVRSFYEEHKDFCTGIVRQIGQDALVEIWDERFFYFVVKFELNFVDTQGKAACLSTVQVDIENAERFDIRFVDQNGSKQYPLILHAAISGGIDRNLYALLELQAARMQRGEKAQIPTWLAPTQVRVIPVSEQFNTSASMLLDQVPYRVDLDDRDLSVSKRIREAEKEWTPYIIVYGEKEKQSGKLTIRPRIGEQFEATLDALLSRLKSECENFPYLPLNLPPHLSKRPQFVG